MSFMTDSKIIQEAQESQEFEQNPQYFNRNINSDQIYSDINALSTHVNTFLKKFNHSNFDQKLKNTNSKVIINEKTMIKQKSQIDQIAFQTQNLISGLNWVNKNRKLSSSKENDKTKNSPIKQIGFQISDVKFDLSRKAFPVNQSFHQKIKNKPIKISTSADIRSLKVCQDLFPKTVNLPRKTSSQIKQKNIKNISKYRSSPFYQQQFSHFQDFDDQITVMNEPTSNVKRKYFKQNNEKVVTSQRTKNQMPYKLTKKKLLQKILNLQNTVRQIKFQKYQDSLIPRKNNIFYAPLQGKHNQQNSTKTKINIRNNYQTPKKFINNLFDSSMNDNQNIPTFNTITSRDLRNKNNNIENNFSQPKAKYSLKNQDRKVSLKKWAEQSW